MEGEIDAVTTRDLERKIRGARSTSDARILVIDVGAVTFVHPAGLGLLVGLSHDVAARSGELVDRSPTSLVRWLLERARLSALIAEGG